MGMKATENQKGTGLEVGWLSTPEGGDIDKKIPIFKLIIGVQEAGMRITRRGNC